MKLLMLTVLTLLFLVSCAMAQNSPEDKILGRWKGYPIPTMLVFAKDHTVQLGDDPGQWCYENGKYLVFCKGEPKDSGWTGQFDAKGRLVINAAKIPDSAKDEGETLIFSREEANKPAGLSATGVTPTVKDLAGEWRFANTIHSHLRLAPTFDVISFTDLGKIQTTSTLISQKFDGNYKLAGNGLKITELGPKRVANELTARLEDNGKSLVLAPKVPSEFYASEWVYLRSDRFVSNGDFAGTWTNKMPREAYHRDMELRKDGRLIVMAIDENGKMLKMINGNEGKHFDYYFVWSSPEGRIITTVYVVPELGVQTVSMKCERKNNELIITPIEFGIDGEMKMIEKFKETWKMKKAM